jgi:hypothetical protein
MLSSLRQSKRETLNAVSVRKKVAECDYEARTRDFFEQGSARGKRVMKARLAK